MPDENLPNIAVPPVVAGAEVWYDYNEFALEHGIAVEEAVDVLKEATFILSELTNGAIHGERCWRDEYRVPPSSYILDVIHGPLKEVHHLYRAHDCGAVLTEVNEWCISTSIGVDIRKNMTTWNGFFPGEWLPWSVGNCNCRPYTYVIEYTQASTLVPGSDRVAKKLAEEYLRARAGKPCSLPERITSVSRQGMSWTILDPQDFLTKGLTGISVVDHWLSVVKRRTNGLSLRDPMHGALLKSESIECPS